MELPSELITAFVALAAAFGGGYMGHKFQNDRDRREYDRRRQDSMDDAERAALSNMIRVCGEFYKTLLIISVRSLRYERHKQFPGVVIPNDEIAHFESTKADFVTAYMQLRSEQLANKAAEASRLANEALTSITTHDLNDLGGPINEASASIMAVAAWARLLYYNLEESIDWNKTPLTMKSMSDHPLDKMFREGMLRASRPPHNEHNQ